MLKALFERWRIRKTFERYVSRDVVQELLDRRFHEQILAPATHTIEVALISIPIADASEYSKCTGVIAEIGCQHGATIHSLSPVAVVSFGCFRTASPGTLQTFVRTLGSRLSGSVAVVYGSVVAQIGTFGSNQYAEVGVWWPGMHATLRQLVSLLPGEIREIHPDTRASQPS